MDSGWQATQEYARRLDHDDPLARFREDFYRPAGTVYMDGNSLGLLSRSAEKAVLAALAAWREQAIGGWLDADPPWFTLGEELGRLQAALVGARPGEVVVTGSTTVNLHNLLGSFYRPKGKRRRILADELNFPSVIYALRGHLTLRGTDPQADLILVPSRDGRTIAEEDIAAAITEEVALVVLPSVLYRSGQLLDLPTLARAAHERGALIGFDLSHSAGVVPHRLSSWDVDFAFWCNYKYLNGGPGCTASLYVNKRHHGTTSPGLAGWWGYRKDKQFDMRLDWEGAGDAGAWQVGTIPVLATAAVAGALRVTLEAGVDAIREKSMRLTEYLISLVDCKLTGRDLGFSVGTPRDPVRRGGHIALEHPEAVRIVKALRARGVIPDFRPPDVIRLAPVPLYCTFEDVWQTIRHLHDIVDRREHLSYTPERGTVA
ncbi:MAG: kynureninase [Bacillota bacterium]|nr:kynureninase [Bacillota bacterium]